MDCVKITTYLFTLQCLEAIKFSVHGISIFNLCLSSVNDVILKNGIILAVTFYFISVLMNYYRGVTVQAAISASTVDVIYGAGWRRRVRRIPCDAR